MQVNVGETVILKPADLESLMSALRAKGYTLVGPTVQDGAILYEEIEKLADIPIGWTDVQGPGTYEVEEGSDGAYFGYHVGPHGLKRHLHAPSVTLFKADRSGGRLKILQGNDERPKKCAFIGVRACDLAAVGVQDRVLLGAQQDAHYARRREGVFTLVVQCTTAGGTCFCASMGAGPKAKAGFDLALTELGTGAGVRFHTEVGSEAAAGLVGALAVKRATAEDTQEAEARVQEAADNMGRRLDTFQLAEILAGNAEHPHWGAVAERCLACGNCTMVCPTCFCCTTEDVTDLTGTQAERRRFWDSCFDTAFTYLHGGFVRGSVQSRYRHWITHKLSTWHDQFGSSGCVGCGRCITWCPVGIDITAEAAIVRATSTAAKERSETLDIVVEDPRISASKKGAD